MGSMCVLSRYMCIICRGLNKFLYPSAQTNLNKASEIQLHITKNWRGKKSTKLAVRRNERKSRKSLIGEMGSIKIILCWRNWGHFIKVLWCVLETSFHIERAILSLSWYKLSGIHWSQFPSASDLLRRHHLLLSIRVSSSIIYTGIRMKCTCLHTALSLEKNCANLEKSRIKWIIMAEKYLYINNIYILIIYIVMHWLLYSFWFYLFSKWCLQTGC